MNRNRNFILKENTDDTIILNPDDYIRYLRMANYDGELVTKLPKLRNKKIIIDGNLILSSTPISKLGNIVKVNGILYIPNTNIESVDGIEYAKIIYNGTPLEIKIKKEKHLQIVYGASMLRKQDVFNLENNKTDTAYRINAAYQIIMDNQKPNSKMADPEYIRQELDKISKLESLMRKNPGSNRIKSFLEKRKNNYDNYVKENPIFDIYCFEKEYSDTFVVYSYVKDFYLKDKAYQVLTHNEVLSSIRDYYQNNIEFFELDKDVASRYLDGYDIAESYETSINDWVRSSPENYFTSEYFTLTPEQESRIEELVGFIVELESKIHNFDGNDAKKLREDIDSYKEEISEIRDTKSVPEQLIVEYVNDWLERIREDPYKFLVDDLNLRSSQIEDYFDFDTYVDDMCQDIYYNDFMIGTGNGNIGTTIIDDTVYYLYDTDI